MQLRDDAVIAWNYDIRPAFTECAAQAIQGGQRSVLEDPMYAGYLRERMTYRADNADPTTMSAQCHRETGRCGPPFRGCN
jgi:hypothetical protein